MAQHYTRTSRFVVCTDNQAYPASLELHKIYRTMPDRAAANEGLLRVIDESGEDYLYPAEWFTPIVPSPSLRRSLVGRAREH